jgi:hypothetical protein
VPGNFDCLGFRVETSDALAELVERVMPVAERVGTRGRGAETLRWQDESGARLVIDLRKGAVHNVLPSFAGTATASVRDVSALNDDTSSADIVDEHRETITRLAVDIEERQLISGTTVRGAISVVGLVGHVSVHNDAEAFAASPASLLVDSEEAGTPPPHFVESGWPWPPRMGAASFISEGLFASPKDARPIARLNGLVLEADERINSLTGLRFVRSRVRTAGFDADLCAPASEMSVPTAGNVLASMVYLVGSLRHWTTQARSNVGWAQALVGRLRGA